MDSDCQEPKDSIMNDRVEEEGDKEAVLREVESEEVGRRASWKKMRREVSVKRYWLKMLQKMME